MAGKEATFDVDDGSVDIQENQKGNPNEKPIVVPQDGDDGQPVAIETDEQDGLDKEEIKIISDTEAQRLGKSKAKPEEGDEEEAESEEDDEATRELKRQRNRARRQATKDRQRRAAQHKNERIRELERQVADLSTAVQSTQKNTKLDADFNQVTRIRDDAASRFSNAESRMKLAFKNGDEEGHAQAMKDMYAAQGMLERAENALENIQVRKKEPEPQRQDGFVAQKAEEFNKNHSWFDQKLGDRDSRRVHRISTDLLREGYKADSFEYWDELEDRIKEELPHKSGNGHDKEEEDEIDETPPPKQQKKLPISSGGGKDVKPKSPDGQVRPSDITPMRRSILRQMGLTEGTPEWHEYAKVYKDKNKQN